MSIEIYMDTGDDAFAGGNGPAEAARILRLLADKIEIGHEGGDLWDENGNRIGHWHAEYTATNADGREDEDEDGDVGCCNQCGGPEGPLGCSSCFDDDGQ